MDKKTKASKKVSLKKMLDTFDVQNKMSNVKLKVNDEEVTIQVKESLSLADVTNLVNFVTEASFWDGEYVPQQTDVAIAYGILWYYTNIDMGADVDFEKFYRFSKYCSLTPVYDAIDQLQLDDIKRFIHESIEYRKQGNISNEKAMIKRAADILQEFTDSANKFFSKTSPEDIQELIKQAQNFSANDVAEDVLKSIKDKLN